METMKFGFLAIFLTTIITNIECFCNSTTLFAGPHGFRQYVGVHSHPNDNCEYSINPGNYSSTDYYLEISWSSLIFDVIGYMPHCNEDYIEVFLTRYEQRFPI